MLFPCSFATDVSEFVCYVFRIHSTKVLGPGSFYEVQKLLPLLTASSPDHPSFHVVAPSLPGYGFSEAPRKQGFGINQYAQVCPLSTFAFNLSFLCLGCPQVDAIIGIRRVW